MSKISIGIVDSGIGNISSLYSALTITGYKVTVTDDTNVLDKVDVILLPGVGAFAPVIKLYDAKGISDYIRMSALKNRPIIGICLGMQLLTDSSEESIFCKGLGVIPGKVVPIENARWHIGWNVLKPSGSSKFLRYDMGASVYFNHGFQYKGDKKYHVAVAEFVNDITAIIKHKNLLGFQFHPEKSQDAGRYILQNSIEELMNAK